MANKDDLSAISYVRDCIIKPRLQDGPLFFIDKDGFAMPRLDGYAIISREEYAALGGVISNCDSVYIMNPAEDADNTDLR